MNRLFQHAATIAFRVVARCDPRNWGRTAHDWTHSKDEYVGDVEEPDGTTSPYYMAVWRCSKCGQAVSWAEAKNKIAPPGLPLVGDVGDCGALIVKRVLES